MSVVQWVCGFTLLVLYNADIGEIIVSYSFEETNECPKSSLFPLTLFPKITSLYCVQGSDKVAAAVGRLDLLPGTFQEIQ